MHAAFPPSCKRIKGLKADQKKHDASSGNAGQSERGPYADKRWPKEEYDDILIAAEELAYFLRSELGVNSFAYGVIKDEPFVFW